MGVFEIATRAVRSHNGYYVHQMCVAKEKTDNVEFDILSIEELIGDVDVLSSKFKYVILACNLVFNEDMQTFNRNKVELNKLLISLSDRFNNVSVFDPNALIDVGNVTGFLKDHTHFRPSFVEECTRNYAKIIGRECLF